MVSSLDSGLRHPGLSPDQSHCILFLGKALYSHSASPLRCIIPTGMYILVLAILMLGDNPATD